MMLVLGDLPSSEPSPNSTPGILPASTASFSELSPYLEDPPLSTSILSAQPPQMATSLPSTITSSGQFSTLFTTEIGTGTTSTLTTSLVAVKPSASFAIPQTKTLSMTSKASVGVVVGVVLLLGLSFGAYIYYRRRIQRKYIVTPFIYTLRIKDHPEPDIKQQIDTVA